ncbi:MAG: cation-translocating P-type ATPase [Candidatus Woesebacteria bacterium]|nr:MAG: cation-translocating P-type ATPase [Candidatus Woesebacteria bacterium]
MTQKGLTTAKANRLLAQYGTNEIKEKPKATLFQVFLSQFTSLLVVLLILASIGSIFLGDLLDGVFILLIVIINGILGFIQEYKAEKAIKALKNMTVSQVRVIRDGVEQMIDSKFIVKGDIVNLNEGDKIPADCVIIEGLHFEANEASLTGESFPVGKNIHDNIFLGTIVSKGRCIAVVEKTGMNTRFGKIAYTLSEIEDNETPLQKKLTLLGKQLGILAIGSSLVVFIIGYFKNNGLIEMILTSVSLAVAAVPEGLPAVITITLALGMERMAKKRAILRKLSSIEALGGVTVIATDKTGTLTKNEMHVTKHWLNSDVKLSQIITAGIVCNNSSLVYKQDSETYDVLGDTTEGALLVFANSNKFDIEKTKGSYELLEEFAFDPTLKLMSVVTNKDGIKNIYSKGAPESILSRCVGMDSKKLIKLEMIFEEYAKQGLRVLALAQKKVKTIPKKREDAEKDLNLLGFVGISDPPRLEVKEAIKIAEVAGIKTIMITGDNELTAKTIAIQIGLIKKNEEIVTGLQFAKMTDDEVLARIDNIRIFARTSPDQKLRIVELLQQKGHVVAVTGDGVNDALAIKQSDVGVAMGITGTDVAKEASDMIITDDNYASLVTAVEEGRTIFDNIKSAIKYLVGCNFGEVAAVLLGMLFGWPLILTPLQLLYVNLVTDGLPAIALAATPKHEGIMKRNPRTNKNIFLGIDFAWFLEVGVLTAGTTLTAFWIGMKSGNIEIARAMAFTTLILVQHFILLDIRVRTRSFFKVNLFKDKFFVFAFTAPLLLQILILYIPYLEGIFKIQTISFIQLFGIVGISSILLFSSEIRKLLFRSFREAN